MTYSAHGRRLCHPGKCALHLQLDGTTATMADATGTTTYSYDAEGDVTSKALVAAGGTGLANATTSYGYFGTGMLASVTYPAYSGSSSPEVTYTYDATGAMASETDWQGDKVSFAHDADGNPPPRTTT